MAARRSIWSWRTCAAIAAGTLATMIAAATGLVTLQHLLGVEWDVLQNVVEQRPLYAPL